MGRQVLILELEHASCSNEMSCEWMQVAASNPPVCLTIPREALPMAVNRRTEDHLGLAEEERLCPSVITVSAPMSTWIPDVCLSTHAAAATLTALPNTSKFETWINYVNLSPMQQDRSDQTYAMELRESSLGQNCPYDFLRSVSYIMSDIIVISTGSLEEAARQYRDWLRSCQRAMAALSASESILRRYTKPFVVLDIVDCVSKEGSEDFLEVVYAQNEIQFLDAKTLRDLSEDIFQEIVFLDQSGDIAAEIMSRASIIRQQRIRNRHLWSQSNFHALHAYTIDRLAGSKPISFVEALIPLLPIQDAKDQLWPELFDQAKTARDFQYFVIPLLSQCMARYFLKCSHGKFSPNL